MPLTCDPAATFEVVLSGDAAKPEPRPTFIFNIMTARQWKTLADFNDDFELAAGSVEKLDLCFTAIRLALAGWRDIADRHGRPIPYDPDNLDELLTWFEAVELMQAAVSQQRLSDDDKKKLDSPSAASTAASVPTAPAPTAAATDPAPPAP